MDFKCSHQLHTHQLFERLWTFQPNTVFCNIISEGTCKICWCQFDCKFFHWLNHSPLQSHLSMHSHYLPVVSVRTLALNEQWKHTVFFCFYCEVPKHQHYFYIRPGESPTEIVSKQNTRVEKKLGWCETCKGKKLHQLYFYPTICPWCIHIWQGSYLQLLFNQLLKQNLNQKTPNPFCLF